MQWAEIRKYFPNEWLVIEALRAHTTADTRRHLDKITVVDRCTDGMAAFTSYRNLHSEFPTREFFYVNTYREELEIYERRWLGIRRGHSHHQTITI